MITLLKSENRGLTQTDWLKSYHSFSFGNYYDPDNIHFGSLRVLNDDVIQPGAGFPTHPHKDMEIVTIVFEGAVAHKDSTGGEGEITVNEIQQMTAGKGIFHSEFNASNTEILKLLQIWFAPNKQGLVPSYEQKKFSDSEKKNKWLKVVSGNKEDRIIFINQDSEIYLTNIDANIKLTYNLKVNRGAYIHLISGSIDVNNFKLDNGDALKITDTKEIIVNAKSYSKLILLDVALEFEN